MSLKPFYSHFAVLLQLASGIQKSRKRFKIAAAFFTDKMHFLIPSQ